MQLSKRNDPEDTGTICYLLLGSNVGDRRAYLKDAELLLARIGQIMSMSKLYETEAWGNTEQPNFLNRAIELHTDRSAHQLLQDILQIERDIGRVRRAHWGPRMIDIDILFYGDQIIEEKQLVIPHQQLHLRNFALIPLLEIAPTLLHPKLLKTIEELYIESRDVLDVVMLESE